MADAGTGATNGLHVKTGGTDLSASDESVHTLSASFNHWWFGTLDWFGTHPIYGGFLCVLVILVFWSRYRLRLERLRQEHKYKMHRMNTQVQPSLPFPNGGGKSKNDEIPRLDHQSDDDA